MVNKVILVGRLGKDPEVRHLENGTPVASFTLATHETYKRKDTGEKVEQTEWHNIVMWRGLAEVAERYLHKGSLVYIEGKLTTRSWDDKEGNKRYTTEIVANSMNMLDKPSSNQNQGTNAGAPQGQTSQADVKPLEENNSEDDLPF